MEITLERSFICEEEEKSDTKASSGCHIKLGSFGYFCLFLDCFLFLINERCYYIYFTQILHICKYFGEIQYGGKSWNRRR